MARWTSIPPSASAIVRAFCGLSFSRSYLDSRGFVRVFRFSYFVKIESQQITSGCGRTSCPFVLDTSLSINLAKYFCAPDLPLGN